MYQGDDLFSNKHKTGNESPRVQGKGGEIFPFYKREMRDELTHKVTYINRTMSYGRKECSHTGKGTCKGQRAPVIVTDLQAGLCGVGGVRGRGRDEVRQVADGQGQAQHALWLFL